MRILLMMLQLTLVINLVQSGKKNSEIYVVIFLTLLITDRQNIMAGMVKLTIVLLLQQNPLLQVKFMFLNTMKI